MEIDAIREQGAIISQTFALESPNLLNTSSLQEQLLPALWIPYGIIVQAMVAWSVQQWTTRIIETADSSHASHQQFQITFHHSKFCKN